MFGFGKQKKDSYQEPQQEEYFYDDYDEGYEDDYGYEAYSEESYARPADTYDDYKRSGRRTRPRNEEYTAELSEEDRSAEPKEESRANDAHLQQEVERLEETIVQLKHQLEVKQTELTTMATTLTEKEQQLQDKQAEKDNHVKQLTEQVSRLELQLTERQTKESAALAAAHQQIQELKQAQEANEEMKDELASILVESKKQEREILERAEYEANGIRHQAEHEAQQMKHDAALELRVMKQEIKNYRKRLRSVQDETAQFFVKLLANSDTLLDEE